MFGALDNCVNGLYSYTIKRALSLDRQLRLLQLTNCSRDYTKRHACFPTTIVLESLKFSDTDFRHLNYIISRALESNFLKISSTVNLTMVSCNQTLSLGSQDEQTKNKEFSMKFKEKRRKAFSLNSISFFSLFMLKKKWTK